jgi:hypothetical protein
MLAKMAQGTQRRYSVGVNGYSHMESGKRDMERVKPNSVHCVKLKYKNAMLAKMAQGTQRRYTVGVN